MAICDCCKKEMLDKATETCDWNNTVQFPDGTILPTVPFVASPRMPPDVWIKKAQESQAELAEMLPNYQPPPYEVTLDECANYQARWDRCHDCGVKSGGKHHPGCDDEECPKCGGQLIGCRCLKKTGDEDDDD